MGNRAGTRGFRESEPYSYANHMKTMNSSTGGSNTLGSEVHISLNAAVIKVRQRPKEKILFSNKMFPRR